MSRVVVHIDLLVVNGPADRHAIETAVREAIGRELSQPGAAGTLVASGDRARVDARGVRPGASPSAIGTVIGRSLVEGGRK